jgi:hypothetical protein
VDKMTLEVPPTILSDVDRTNTGHSKSLLHPIGGEAPGAIKPESCVSTIIADLNEQGLSPQCQDINEQVISSPRTMKPITSVCSSSLSQLFSSPTERDVFDQDHFFSVPLTSSSFSSSYDTLDKLYLPSIVAPTTPLQAFYSAHDSPSSFSSLISITHDQFDELTNPLITPSSLMKRKSRHQEGGDDFFLFDKESYNYTDNQEACCISRSKDYICRSASSQGTNPVEDDDDYYLPWKIRNQSGSTEK